MKKTLIAALCVLTSTSALANHHSISNCIKNIEKLNNGEITKLEALSMNGKSIFEFEVINSAGKEFEYMCDAKTSKIIETETEVDSADDKLFSKAKISLTKAIEIATKAYPGKVVEVEFEIESNGAPTYEIDIMGKKGVETKVEVDAISGKIIEVYKETWEIGYEANERH